MIDEEGNRLYNPSHHDLADSDEWNRLGAAIGRSRALRTLNLTVFIEEEDHISSEAYQSMDMFYNGLTKNCSIEILKLDMNVFSNDENFPLWNLGDVQFKDSVKDFTLNGRLGLNNNTQGIIISSFLESTSLDTFNMWCRLSNEPAFRAIVSTCSTVKKLQLACTSIAQYALIASLLENDRSVTKELKIVGTIILDEQLTTIAAGLINNTSLKKLELPSYEGNCSPMTKVLCDATSIECIHASNHTLEMIECFNDHSPLVEDCLKLNTNASKNTVIKTKIARYYFVGHFDISSFANMPVSVLPEVLSLIRGDTTNRQSAIFRMLKCIPALCNVSSRDARPIDGHRDGGRGSDKRPKISSIAN